MAEPNANLRLIELPWLLEITSIGYCFTNFNEVLVTAIDYYF